MDHALLVRVLNCAGHREKQFQAVPDGHPFDVAVLRNWSAIDVLHYEVRPALWRGTRIEDARDVRVVHHRQRLALVAKARQYFVCVHSEFDDFEGDGAANGFALLGQVDGSHTAFAKRSKDVITAEVVIGESRRQGVNSVNSGVAAAKRTLEHALHQALRAQSRGIIGSQFRSALRAACHRGRFAAPHSSPFAEASVTFRPAIPYSCQVRRIRTGHPIGQA